MQISQEGLALIKRFEGFSPTPYICPAGKETIGYGHVIHPVESYPPEGISEAEAEKLLKQDVSYAESILEHAVLVPLSQSQFDALASLIYNIGIKAFVNSTLLRRLNERNHAAAASEIGRWVYAGGKILPGLVKRRATETALFTAGGID
jgi:lysozyme